MAIDITVPARGQQPREIVVEVVTDTFDAAYDLAQPGAHVPQLQPSLELARAAQASNDLAALDAYLRDVAVAAIATRVKVRAVAAPDRLNDEGAHR